MPRKRDDESGLYTEVYSDDQILGSLEGTRMSTSEVADALGCHRTTAHERLSEMKEQGLVESTQVGNTLIWDIQ